MTTPLQDFRAKFPQYEDLVDEDLARALFAKFEAESGGGVSFEEFASEFGLDASAAPEEGQGSTPENSPSRPPERSEPRSQTDNVIALPQRPMGRPGTISEATDSESPESKNGSRRSGKVRPLEDIVITERQTDENGNVFEVEMRADIALEDADQRIQSLSDLLDCLAG